MSENGNGNGHLIGGLAGMFATGEIDIPLNMPRTGTYSGITFYFEPMDARTDQRYTQILQRNVGRNKTTNDEALQYVFKHKLARVVFEEPAKDAETELRQFGCADEQIELYKKDPARFFLSLPQMWMLVRPITYKYLNEVSPEAGDSKSDF